MGELGRAVATLPGERYHKLSAGGTRQSEQKTARKPIGSCGDETTALSRPLARAYHPMQQDERTAAKCHKRCDRLRRGPPQPRSSAVRREQWISDSTRANCRSTEGNGHRVPTTCN